MVPARRDCDGNGNRPAWSKAASGPSDQRDGDCVGGEGERQRAERGVSPFQVRVMSEALSRDSWAWSREGKKNERIKEAWNVSIPCWSSEASRMSPYCEVMIPDFNFFLLSFNNQKAQMANSSGPKWSSPTVNYPAEFNKIIYWFYYFLNELFFKKISTNKVIFEKYIH